MEGLDYWMYAELIQAAYEKLQKEIKDWCGKQPLVLDTKEKEQVWKNILNNKFHPIGKANLSLKRLEEIRDETSDEMKNVLSKKIFKGKVKRRDKQQTKL